MVNKPRPLPLAMVICDIIIEDKKTGKKSLIGIFDNIHAKSAPCVHPRLNVFISLTEGNGDYNAKLRCVYIDEDKQIAEIRGPIIFNNPLQIIEFNFEICGIKLPQYGNYRFDFYCNEELIISRKFNLLPITPAERKSNG
jgi:hypothetical protein